MSMFTLAISCLTTCNPPWFMDLTFQVPMQHCSLQHWIFLLSPVTSTTGCCFCFGSVPSFFLELFLHSSLVTYWPPNQPGSSSFSVLSFCLFILFMGFSRLEYQSGLAIPFSSGSHFVRLLHHDPVHLDWPYMAWLSFIELDKAVVHMIRLASSLWLWFHSVCPPMTSLTQHVLSYWGFQKITRRDKKAFLNDQWKEIEESNKVGKTRDLFKKIRDTKGTFHAKMDSIKDRNGMDLTEKKILRRGGKSTQKNCTKRSKWQIITMVWLLT